MRWLLILFVGALTAIDVFSLDQSAALGLSIKNGALYLLAATMLFRTVIAGEIQMELTQIHTLFAAWIGYAAVTCLAAAFVLHYPDYHLSAAVISLKSMLVDSALFFLIAFYGLRNEADVRLFLKALAAALCIANVITLADVAGLVHVPTHIGESGAEEGRVYGYFGHANETGSLIACMLPLMLAVAQSGRPLVRGAWYVGILASIAVLVMTVSRGAFAAVLVSAVAGAFLCRKYIRVSRLILWGVAAVSIALVAVSVVSLVDPQTRDILEERLLGQSTSIDMGVVSSGRNVLWRAAIERMMDSPLSLITGFGWYVYESMPFSLSTHNYYLELWFDLGLLGVAVFVLIMRRAVVMARAAMPYADEEMRRYLIAFVFAVLALVVAVFFTLIFKPWPYLWMYMGAMLRAITIAQAAREPQAAPAAAPLAPAVHLARAGVARPRGAT